MAASEATENSSIKCPTDEANMQVSENGISEVKLSDLKVVDLKMQLEKRDLDKSGVKSILMERLKKALIDEGEDPDEFTFEISSDTGAGCKSPVRKKKKPITGDANQSVEDVIEGTKEITNHINEEKNNCDVTLQLSLDEEEAQLNEEENSIEASKPSDSDTAEKLDEKVIPEDSSTDKSEGSLPTASPQKTSSESTPVKSSKLNEDAKEKKNIKTTTTSKISDIATSVSPKVLKVIGKNEKMKSPNVLAKSLWITGLPNTTRAADLKALFSKQGRVLSVKIVKSTKQTPGKCYGFVTMATSKDASKAIQNLHRTELNGRTISVERTQSEPSTLLKKSESKLITLGTKRQTLKKEAMSSKTSDGVKKVSTVADKSAKSEVKSVAADSSKSAATEESGKHKEDKSGSSEKAKSKEKDRKSRERKEKDTRRSSFRKPSGFRPRPFAFNERPRYGSFRRPFGRKPFMGRSSFGTSSFRPRSTMLDFEKIRQERLHQREYFREREAERIRIAELYRNKHIERKQREEAYRLEREKEKLRLEREILERERAEILKLEREKQRFERERLEREREELRRHTELRRSTKRPFSRVEREADTIWDARKKPATRYEGRSSFREGSSSSRYEFAARERPSFTRHEFERHPERYTNQKSLNQSPRPDFGDRETRREVTIRTRDERQVYSRSDFRDRESRRSFPPRERERHVSSRREREQPRIDWKHDRRVHERIVTPSSSGQRRMTYY